MKITHKITHIIASILYKGIITPTYITIRGLYIIADRLTQRLLTGVNYNRFTRLATGVLLALCITYQANIKVFVVNKYNSLFTTQVSAQTEIIKTKEVEVKTPNLSQPALLYML